MPKSAELTVGPGVLAGPDTYHRALSSPNEVAREVLDEVQAGSSYCPCCGAPSRKSFYADGDSESCSECGEEYWFELQQGSIVPHKARQAILGSSLSDLLSKRSAFPGATTPKLPHRE